MDTSARDFDEFYLATSARTVRQVYALTGDREEALDVAQEAYARAWSQWRKVSRYDNPDAWVRTVAYRLAVSAWRRRRRGRAAWSLLGAAPNVADNSPDAVLLAAALKRVTANHRRVLVLHYLADLSVAQIAVEMGVPVGSVKAWLARGRAALAIEIGSLDGPTALTSTKEAT